MRAGSMFLTFLPTKAALIITDPLRNTSSTNSYSRSCWDPHHGLRHGWNERSGMRRWRSVRSLRLWRTMCS
uniref:Putative secreted peptide n=1 Tax=Anopheles braziliensis TaxID=58242 RepID=A0A2M3ZVT1_9DIPT